MSKYVIFTFLLMVTVNVKSLERKPDSVIPISYDLTITPKGDKFDGKVKINFTVSNTTDILQLDSSKLAFLEEDCKLILPTSESINCMSELDGFSEFVNIKASINFTPNTNYQVQLNYTGKYKETPLGLSKISYNVNKETRNLTFANFKESFARDVFPCINEPQFKTPFTLYLIHPEHYRAISMVPKQYTSYNEGAKTTSTKFQIPPLPLSSLWFAILDHTYTSTVQDNIVFWHNKIQTQHNRELINHGSKFMKIMENHLNITSGSYPITIIAKSMSMDRMQSLDDTKIIEINFFLAHVHTIKSEYDKVLLAHKLVHRWFGNLITPTRSEDFWLKEALATYFQYFGTAKIRPEWNLEHVFVVEELQEALRDEGIEHFSSLVTNVELIKKTKIKRKDHTINYQKRASIIRMLAHTISQETLSVVLHTFFKNGMNKHNGSVTSEHLYEAIDEQSKHTSFQNLPTTVKPSQMLRGWIKNWGHPLISVERNNQPGSIVITQTTYTNEPNIKTDPKWTIPLTYTTKSESQYNTKPKIWLSDRNITLSIKIPADEWILFNLQQSGYYRVNYSEQNWNLLIRQLNEYPQKIHILNRVQLLDDAVTLANDDQLNFAIPLRLFKYLSKETEFVPWFKATFHLDSWYTIFQGFPVQEAIRSFASPLYEEAFNKFGFHPKATDSYILKMKRPFFLQFVCKMGVKECINDALREYQKNQNTLDRIHRDWKELIYCEALRSSENPKSVFENLWKEYSTTSSRKVKTIILRSLPCLQDTGVIKIILFKLLATANKEISDNDYGDYVLPGFSSSMYVVNATIKFCFENKNKLLEIANSHTEISHIIKILHNSRLDSQLEQLERLMILFEDMSTSLGNAFEGGYETAYLNNKLRLKFIAEDFNSIIQNLKISTFQ